MQENEKKKIKRVKLILGTSIFLIVFSFAFAIGAEILQKNGYGDYWSPLVGLLGFFSFMIIAIVLLFSQFKDAFVIDYNATIKKLDEMDVCVTNGIDPLEIFKKLSTMGFKNGDYLSKKRFHFLKDFILYHYKYVESTNLINTIPLELSKYYQLDIKCKNACFILVVKKENVTKTDLSKIKALSKKYMMMESFPFIKTAHTCLLVLCDKDNKYYYYSFSNKCAIKVYAYGARLLLQLIKK